MLCKDREQRCQSVQRVIQELTRDVGKACPHCSAPNRGSALYCDQCGHSLNLPAKGVAGSVAISAPELTDEGFRLGA
jgi:predicted RNA-binding Zn-ribbon protein involved in translation (DUF1610 family)